MTPPVAVRLVPGANGEPSPSRREHESLGAPLDDFGAWLRDILWAVGPVAPAVHVESRRTVVLRGDVGAIASGAVTVHNEQRAAVVSTLSPTPLRDDRGTTWLPSAVDDTTVVVPPGESRTVELSFFVPTDLPPGLYRGSIVLLATSGDEVPLVVEVGDGG